MKRIRDAFLRFASASYDIYEWLGGDDFVRLHKATQVVHKGNHLVVQVPNFESNTSFWSIDLEKTGLDSYKVKVFKFTTVNGHQRLYDRKVGLSANQLYAYVVRVIGHPYYSLIRQKVE